MEDQDNQPSTGLMRLRAVLNEINKRNGGAPVFASIGELLKKHGLSIVSSDDEIDAVGNDLKTQFLTPKLNEAQPVKPAGQPQRQRPTEDNAIYHLDSEKK